MSGTECYSRPIKLDLTDLIDDYPTVMALAFDASGKRLAIGAALYVLIYEVVSANELRLLEEFPVNGPDDDDAADGDAIVEKIAFANDPDTILVRLTTHSGSFGFNADRSFAISSGERLSCSLRGDYQNRYPVFAAESTEVDEQDVPEELDTYSAQRLWSSDDGGDELWANESGLLVRRQPENERTTILRDGTRLGIGGCFSRVPLSES